jgi:type II secretory pathway component GspD/PulD (secretin)
MDTLAEAARAKPPANACRLVLHPLKHADAVRLASVLTSALGSSRGIRFAGDSASQTLIVYASPSEDAELTTLIDRLDVPPREAAQ